MLESMYDVGNCADVARLEAQRAIYSAEIAEYCKVNPLCAAIIMKMSVDEEFLRFISLVSLRTALTARINELEEEK